MDLAPADGAVEAGRVCGTCESAPFKYKCPSCATLSCSVACVRQHKQIHSCSGSRKRASRTFYPQSQLTPDILHDDYGLLEECAGIAGEAGAPALRATSPSRASGARLKGVLKRLAGGPSGTRLLLMPSQMSRARANRTHLSQGPTIRWTIEWILLPTCEGSGALANLSCTAGPLDPRLLAAALPASTTLQSLASENDSIFDAFQSALLSPSTEEHILLFRRCLPAASSASALSDSSHQTDRAATDDMPSDQEEESGLAFFLKMEPPEDTASGSGAAIPLSDASASIATAIAGRTIIEFPTIYVAMPATARRRVAASVAASLTAAC